MQITTNKTTNKTDVCAVVLETALEQFSAKGYFNTSVQDIRRAANVSIGSIYHHFQSKEAIAKALYDTLIDELSSAIDEILNTYGTTHDRSKAVIETLFKLAEKKPDVMQYILCAKHREFMPDEQPICSSRPFEQIMAMVRQGIEKKEIRDIDPVVATAALFGSTIRLIHLRLDNALDNPLPSYLDAVWQCAWDSVKIK